MNQSGLPMFHVPPIDMRGGDEIENELDEEFAFHLEQSARDLRNEGRSSTEAQREARARFGDIETIKRDCKRIAMKERIMLQRINLALMIVVLIVVGLVSVQMFTTQSYNTLALQAITADLAQMKFDVGNKDNKPSVFIEGDVGRPGPYALPIGGRLTLSRFFKAAGGLTSSSSHVKVFRNVNGRQAVVVDRTIDMPDDLGEDDIDLEPDDVILVTATGVASSSTASGSASVLVEGAVERPGWYPIITQNGATYLHEIFDRAGVKEQMWFKTDQSELTPTNHFLGDDPTRRVLKPDQEIRVYDTIPDQDRRADRRFRRPPSPGLWREIDQKGIPVESGQALSIDRPRIDPSEMGKPAAVYGPWCELRDGQSRPISLQLCDARKAFMFDSGRSRALGIATWSYSRGPRHADGDWERVSLRLSSGSEAREWIYFEPVEMETDNEDAPAGNAVESDEGA